MKKSLIALAVMAVSGVAMAQSSVTVYGVVDAVIHKDKGVSTTMTSGGVSSSRLGFKGTEDLGGGLKANFKLEQGFSSVSGDESLANKAFGREASVGLSGSFGAFRIGRMATAFDDYAGATNPVFDSVLAPTNVFVGYSTGRVNQGLYYETPSFGGFSGAVSYNLEQVPGSQNVLALAANYAAGPLALGLAYQDEGDAADETHTRLNAAYDFGAFKLMGGYELVKDSGVDTKQYTIGADMPLASNLVLSAGVASSKTDGAKRLTGYSAGAAYLLSKRTTVYGGFYADNGDAGTSLKRRVGAGVKHTF
jgi:predicted porin